jgi:hypothetical protein
MTKSLTFKVDPRITEVLGEGYRSSEQAIKELVDNAWDAEATKVAITLPEPMTDTPVIVSDNGSGMTAAELEQEYLNVGRNRREFRGEQTQRLRRFVKGRKGVGKFAGLMVADSMEIITCTRAVKSTIKLSRSALLEARGDFEEFNIPILEDLCSLETAGTSVILRDLHQQLVFPNPEKLRAMLVREYGREENFEITVNGQLAGFEDLPGPKFEAPIKLSNGGSATLKFTVVDGKRKLPDAGISVRCDGKVVGDPQLLGVETNEVIPSNLKGRIYGEIEVHGMELNAITADGGSFVENNKTYQEIKAQSQIELERGLEKARGMEMRAAKARYQKIINQKIEKLPEYRRQFATRALERVLERFYFENEERFESIISVVLDSLKRDDYWLIMQKIDSARHSDIAQLAEALTEFGIWDLSLVGTQARRRQIVLDDFRKLLDNPKTKEAEVHQVLESNLWLLEYEGKLISSNESIKKVVNDYLGGKYSGNRGNKRPDLLIGEDMTGHHLVVELKAPSVEINRKMEAQALEYRDDLQNQLQKIHVLLLGFGKVSEMSSLNEREGITILSYHELIGRAESRLKWLIDELKAA